MAGAAEASRRPPLVFVHGSYHAAWCFDDKFLPFFAAAGYDCYAISMRGQGGSDRPSDPALTPATLNSHSEDLASFLKSLGRRGGLNYEERMGGRSKEAHPHMPFRPAVVTAHSFGGLLLQKYALDAAARPAEYPELRAMVFLNSVPPSGNGPMVLRFLLRSPLLSLRITRAFVAKTFASSLADCREMFFSESLPEADLKRRVDHAVEISQRRSPTTPGSMPALLCRYQAQLAACSPIKLIDLRAMSKSVPLPPAPRGHPPVLVLGGTKDNVVDAEAVRELAAYYGVSPVLVEGLPHDSMLDVQAEQVAQQLLEFVEPL